MIARSIVRQSVIGLAVVGLVGLTLVVSMSVLGLIPAVAVTEMNKGGNPVDSATLKIGSVVPVSTTIAKVVPAAVAATEDECCDDNSAPEGDQGDGNDCDVVNMNGSANLGGCGDGGGCGSGGGGGAGGGPGGGEIGVRLDGIIDFEHNPTYSSGSTSNVSRNCLLYTSPSPRDATLSRMPSSA